MPVCQLAGSAVPMFAITLSEVSAPVTEMFVWASQVRAPTAVPVVVTLAVPTVWVTGKNGPLLLLRLKALLIVL